MAMAMSEIIGTEASAEVVEGAKVYKLVAGMMLASVAVVTLDIAHKDDKEGSLVYASDDGEFVFSIHENSCTFYEDNKFVLYDQYEDESRFFVVTASNVDDAEDGYYTFTARGMVDPRMLDATDEQESGETAVGG